MDTDREQKAPTPRRATTPSSGQKSLQAPSPHSISQHSILALQRTAGNAAVAAAVQRVSDVTSPSVHPNVQREDEAETTAETPTPPEKVILWPTSEPHDFFRNRPNLLPNGGLKPPTVGASAIDWGQLASVYTSRDLTLSDPDRQVIAGHWLRWYPVAQALHKLPIAKSLFPTPAAIMNTLTAKMIDSSIAGSNPSMIEQFNADAEKFGVTTTTVGVDLFKF